MENVQPRLSRTGLGENYVLFNKFAPQIPSSLDKKKSHAHTAMMMVLDENALLKRVDKISFLSKNSPQETQAKYLDWMAMQEMQSSGAQAMVLQKNQLIQRLSGGVLFIRKGQKIQYIADQNNLYMQKKSLQRAWQKYMTALRQDRKLQNYSWQDQTIGHLHVSELEGADEIWAYHFIKGIMGLSLQSKIENASVGMITQYLQDQFSENQ